MNRLPTLLAAAALVTACAPGTEDTAPSRGELVMQTLVEAIQAADTAAILDLFRTDATYDDFANQVTYQGPEEIVGYLTSPHAWGDDVYMNVGRIHAGLDAVTAEWLFSAVQTRPMGDLAPEGTGREVVLNGVTILELDGSRIVRAADYVDTAQLLLQIGARIELPGGTVLSQEPAG